MPLCSPYPSPLSVLVMDNAKIHHGDEILELADQFGVSLAPKTLFLILILCQVSALSTYHHTCETSTLLKRHSQRSRPSSTITMTYSRLLKMMGFCMICMRWWMSLQCTMLLAILYMWGTSRQTRYSRGSRTGKQTCTGCRPMKEWQTNECTNSFTKG